MKPSEIITLMKHYRMLEPEPRTSREKFTSAVQYLMIKNNNMKPVQLAKHINVAPSYVRRKISEGRWTFEDIDDVAKLFKCDQGDLIHGYKRMAQRDREAARKTSEEPQGEEDV